MNRVQRTKRFGSKSQRKKWCEQAELLHFGLPASLNSMFQSHMHIYTNQQNV
jgi:hypothetical protein